MGSSCSSAENTTNTMDNLASAQSKRSGVDQEEEADFLSPLHTGVHQAAQSKSSLQGDKGNDDHDSCLNESSNGESRALSLPEFELPACEDRTDMSSDVTAADCSFTPRASSPRGCVSRQSTLSRSRPFMGSNTILGASHENMALDMTLIIDDDVTETSSNGSEHSRYSRRSVRGCRSFVGSRSERTSTISFIEPKKEEWKCEEPTPQQQQGSATSPSTTLRARLRAMEAQYKLRRKTNQSGASSSQSMDDVPSAGTSATTMPSPQQYAVPSIISQLQRQCVATDEKRNQKGHDPHPVPSDANAAAALLLDPPFPSQLTAQYSSNSACNLTHNHHHRTSADDTDITPGQGLRAHTPLPLSPLIPALPTWCEGLET